METVRSSFKNARRVVIKVGSRVLVQKNGRPDIRRMRHLSSQIAALKHSGCQPILVSSGAVGAGMEALGLRTRPKNLPDLQMAAAVGQSRLMARYDELFKTERCKVGQVLLTHSDLKQRTRHLNARNTLMNLIRNDIIPIINENDVVSVDEIKFGDNDMLAALVSILIQADVLIMLTVADGVRRPQGSTRTQRIQYVETLDDEVFALAKGKNSGFSTGGMLTKLEAAKIAADSGCAVVIANGRQNHVLTDLMEGKDRGTLIGRIVHRDQRSLSGRKSWLAHFHRAQGAVMIDAGAQKAVCAQGRSLLPIGIKIIEGTFDKGALVNIKTEDGRIVARGLVDYSADQLARIKGHKTSEIETILGTRDYDEVIHRDNMVILHQ